MRKFIVSMLLMTVMSITSWAQGWPENYDGVMLQGFYWDSYTDTQWSNLEAQADDMAPYFKLIWVPNSAYAGSLSMNMGYHPIYWFDHKSAFGTEDALRSMIRTFKEKGTGFIEDVVINHRLGVSSWTDFPAETVNGVTYQLTSDDICSDDEAASNGYAVGKNKDTGGTWGGARDLDHLSDNVQKNVIAYLRYLIDDLGYVGFRYDYVKGYAPKFTGLYNSTVNPQFSVGECWDNLTTVRNWIDGTITNGKIQSAAFDFPMKDIINNAFANNNWGALAGECLATSAGFDRFAVTFVDNHDTGRPKSDGGNPLYANIEAANAFILTMPGTPCVWLSHWKSYKVAIKKLILTRKACGVHSQSTILDRKSVSGGFLLTVKGTKGNMRVLFGNPTGVDMSGYQLAVEGTNYKCYASEGVDLSALSEVKDDTESFVAPEFCVVNEGEVCAFFEAPQTWTAAIKCWAWDSGNYTGGSWPGVTCALVGTAANKNKVYKWTWNGNYTGTTATQPQFIIFSNNGTPQTSDMDFKNGGYYNASGLQGVVTGIGDVVYDNPKHQTVYNLQGQRVDNQYKGVVIVQGKKMIR